jgi:hypothetical protein
MGQGHEYRVLATRFRDWWLVEIPNLATHAERRLFTDVERTAREAISQALDIELDAFDVAVELQRAWHSVLRGGA